MKAGSDLAEVTLLRDSTPGLFEAFLFPAFQFAMSVGPHLHSTSRALVLGVLVPFHLVCGFSALRAGCPARARDLRTPTGRRTAYLRSQPESGILCALWLYGFIGMINRLSVYGILALY